MIGLPINFVQGSWGTTFEGGLAPLPSHSLTLYLSLLAQLTTRACSRVVIPRRLLVTLRHVSDLTSPRTN